MLKNKGDDGCGQACWNCTDIAFVTDTVFPCFHISVNHCTYFQFSLKKEISVF